MSIKTFLLFLPSILLLLLYRPVGATDDINCVPYARASRQQRKYPKPLAADCLHIISLLPSSLHLEPGQQHDPGQVSVTYGRLITHRYDLPASFIHRTCQVSIIDPSHPDDGPMSRQDAAYYLWNPAKALAKRLIDTCFSTGENLAANAPLGDIMPNQRILGSVHIEPSQAGPLMRNVYYL